MRNESWDEKDFTQDTIQMDPQQKPAWLKTLKFIFVAGVGFFTDGYINFVIGLIVPILGMLYYSDENNKVPTRMGDVVKGSASLGMIAGQILFGCLGDAVGRRKVYGKELLFTLFGSLMVIVVPRNLSPHSILSWIAVFRTVTGFGIGGDYPMSSTLSMENERKGFRSDLIILIFAFLGVGSFVSGLVFLILLSGFQKHIEQDIFYLEYVWRLLIGIGMIPGILTLYARFKMAETQPYKKYVNDDGFKGHVAELKEYFSQWKHLRTLIATCSIWFLFDIAFYGVNFNQASILESIGFGSADTRFQTLRNLAIGNVICAALGFLPGYYLAIPLLRILGRVQQQIILCFVVAFMYAVWAGVFHTANTAGKVVIFALSQLFLNAGASATTFIIPVEVFPTRVRASAHGLSAAIGKAGAVLTSFAFGTVTEKIGLRSVLGLFSGIMAICAILSFIIPEPRSATLEMIENDYLYQNHKISDLFQWYGTKGHASNNTQDDKYMSDESKDQDLNKV